MSTIRFRLFLVIAVWLATIAAITFWLVTTETPQIRLAAGEKGSESYQLAGAMAETLNATAPGFQIRIYDTGGSAESLALVENGQVDLAVVQADRARPDGVLDIARLYPGAFHLLVNADRGVESFPRLRGLRVAIPPRDSGQNQVFWSLADHYNLEADDIVALPMAPEAAYFALSTGQVDAAFTVRAPGNVRVRKLMADGALELVGIDQAAALELSQPALSQGLIPMGSYGGDPATPPSDLPVPVLDRILVGHSKLSENLVFLFTRRLFELQADIVEQLPLAGFIDQVRTGSGVDSKTHPGARRYYDREKPGLVQENARLASAILYTVVIFISAVVALRSRWLKARRLRMADFNKRLMEIAARARDSSDRRRLLASKRALVDILAEVVNDLDAEKVTQEEFDHFSFTWQAVNSVVRDQLEQLQQSASALEAAR